MTTRDIAALICKSLALFFIVPALSQLPPAIQQSIPTPNYSSPVPGSALSFFGWTELLPIVVQLVLACLLWFGAERMARYMVRAPEEAGALVMDRKVQVIAFFVFGLLILVQAVPRLVFQLLQAYMVSRADPIMRGAAVPSVVPQILTELCQIMLGLWLMHGAPGKARVFASMRDAGRDKEEASA